MSEEVYITVTADGSATLLMTVMNTDDICVCGQVKKALACDAMGTVHILCLECNRPDALPAVGRQHTLDRWLDNEGSEEAI